MPWWGQAEQGKPFKTKLSPQISHSKQSGGQCPRLQLRLPVSGRGLLAGCERHCARTWTRNQKEGKKVLPLRGLSPAVRLERKKMSLRWPAHLSKRAVACCLPSQGKSCVALPVKLWVNTALRAANGAGGAWGCCWETSQPLSKGGRGGGQSRGFLITRPFGPGCLRNGARWWRLVVCTFAVQHGDTDLSKPSWHEEAWLWDP